MTIKAFFLNRLLIRNTSFLLVVISGALVNTLVIGSCLAENVIAQKNSTLPDHILPPPPPLAPPNIIIKTKESLAAPDNIEPPRSIVQGSQNEYIFKAPNSTSTSYKVEVFGKSSLILNQVREVEPKAFIKGNVIQVGIFSEEANAMELVRQLTLRGLWARVVVTL